MFFAVVDTIQRAIVPDIIKMEHRGTAFGALHMTIGITAFISSLIAGTLWQIYGAFVPFIFGAIISITSAILLSTYTLRKP
jgi:MFS family permease